MTIGKKLSFSFAMLLFFLIALITISQIINIRATKNYQHIKNVTAPALNTITTFLAVQYELELLTLLQINKYDLPSSSQYNRIRGIIEVEIPRLQSSINIIREQLEKDDPKIHLYNSINSQSDQVIELSNKLINVFKKKSDYANEDKVNYVKSIVLYKLLPLFSSTEQHLKELQIQYESEDSINRDQLSEIFKNYNNIIIIMGIIGIFISVIVSWKTVNSIRKPVSDLTKAVKQIEQGNYKESVTIKSNDEISILGKSINLMARSLYRASKTELKNKWISEGKDKLRDKLHGLSFELEFTETTITFLLSFLEKNIGLFYILNDTSNYYHFSYGQGYKEYEKIIHNFQAGTDYPGSILQNEQPYSTAFDAEAKEVHNFINPINSEIHLYNIPLIADKITYGIIILGGSTPINKTQALFINEITEILAIHIKAILERQKVQTLLRNSEIQTKFLNKQKLAIEEQASKLRKANRHKSEFLANMSHELRTPMNSIILLSELLSQNNFNHLSEDEVESAKMILTSGHNLLNLINEILDLSKIESGNSQIQVNNTPINDIIESVKDVINPLIEAGQNTLTVETDASLPEQINTDPDKLRQILINLLNNANKFTENGTITARFKTLNQDDSIEADILTRFGNVLKIDIIDTGIGIPEEKIKTIFGAFKQVDSSLTKQYEGTGLGLAIVKNLCDQLSAEIIVSSIVGKGSTFSILLPSLDSQLLNV